MRTVLCFAFVPRALAALGACFSAASGLAQEVELRIVSQVRLEHPTEIAAYDRASGRVIVTLGGTPSVGIIDIEDPRAPAQLGTIDFGDLGPLVNSVAARDGLFAAAVSADPVTDPGWVVVFDVQGRRIAEVRVGAMPDMVCFTPDGKRILTANEGEPNGDGSIDPPGSVSTIELSGFEVTDVALSNAPADQPVTWLTSPELTPATHIEPEYIAVSPDSRRAYVVCQENNAVAEIDLATREIAVWHRLGVADRSGLEALRQPDGIVALATPGGLRIVTANEGDPRTVWGGDGVDRHDGIEVAATSLSGTAVPTRFGTGGITVFDEHFAILGDRGPDIIEHLDLGAKNGTITEHAIETIARRDDKRGVEPEGLAHLKIGKNEHIFVGLERAGMIAHYTLDNDDALTLVGLASIPTPEDGGHLASPEGLLVVPPDRDGREHPILVVTDEVHGTLTLYEICSD